MIYNNLHSVNTLATPSISIITPAKNSARHISDLLQSISRQYSSTDGDLFEHILVIGESSDNTLEIARIYQDSSPYAVTIIYGVDRDHVDALNIGVRHARGDLIGIANSDDYYSARTLSLAAYAYRQKRGVKHFFCYGICKIESPGMKTQYHHPRSSYAAIMRGRYPVNPISYFYSRELHYSVGLYNPLYPAAHDIDFLVKIAPHAKHYFIDQVLGIFRLHEGSITYKIYNGCQGEKPFELKELLQSHKLIASWQQLSQIWLEDQYYRLRRLLRLV